MRIGSSIAAVLACITACGGDAEAPRTQPTAAPRAPVITPQVCGGSYHTCVLRADGSVMCTGRNLDGQLGDGTTEDRTSFTRVVGLEDATQIDCGAHHTCATRSTGHIVCWGRNSAGQIGSGDTVAHRAPTPVRGLADGVEVACGGEVSCARRTNGTVVCWGKGDDGQLGNGGVADAKTPVPVTGLTNAVEIDVGQAHACARLAPGTISCWGRNNARQLGQGASTQRAANPLPVEGLAGVTAIGTGGAHSCAATATGLFCWGETSEGQVMNGQSGPGTEDVGAPLAVAGVSGVVELALGAQSTCMRLASGEVRCAGYNNSTAKLLGTASTERVLTTPTAVTGLRDASSLGTGYMHTCAVRRSGALVCWGSGGDGQRGDGLRSGGDIRDVVHDIATLVPATSMPPTFPPTSGVTPQVVPHFAVGDKHVCGVLADGRVQCFGSGDAGQLGNGETRGLRPDAGVFVPGITDAERVVASQNHTCVVRANGRVACFGTPGATYRNAVHRATSSPVPIDAFTEVTDLAMSISAICAVRRDHTVWCLGSNELGQLGNGTRAPSATTAVEVVGIADAERIAASSSAFCALRAGGKLSCWGSGNNGELGSGPRVTTALAPIELALTDVTHIAGAFYNFCAVHGGGKVSCWGDADNGQIGNGTASTRTNAFSPTLVKGVRDAVSTGLGYANACATTSAGEAYCWGMNAFGQTGHAATEPNPQPTPWQVLRTRDATVATFAPYLTVDCGSNHCCGLHRDGHVSCAGSTPIGGPAGFIGIGATLSTFPVAAPGMRLPAAATPPTP